MTREWSTGTVAMVTVFGQEHVAIRQGHGWCNGCADENTMGPVKSVRPLLVLDPEDGRQLTRLAEALRNVSGNLPIYADDMAAAVRSLLDPKPEEPKGHFAVVVDRNGVRWVNWRDPRATRHHERPWVKADDSRECREYADIDVTEVLSHGVTEDGV